MNNSKTLFFYTPQAGEGAARIAIAGRIENDCLTLAFARCSEFDRFVKKKGRSIAENRLSSPKHSMQMDFPLKEGDKTYGKRFIQCALDFAGEVERRVQKDRERLIEKKTAKRFRNEPVL